MKLFKFILGLVSGATVGMLCAKKTGETLRTELKGKTTEQKAKIIGSELIDIGKELSALLQDIPENDQVKEISKLGKTKVKEMIKNAKASGSEGLKEYLPILQDALKEIESGLKEGSKTLKKQGQVAKKDIKKSVNKAVKKIKKKINK